MGKIAARQKTDKLQKYIKTKTEQETEMRKVVVLIGAIATGCIIARISYKIGHKSGYDAVTYQHYC